MPNILKPVGDVIKIHDAAVNSGTIDNEKLGTYIPNQFSSGYTGSTLQSIARAGSHLKRVRIVSVKAWLLAITLAGQYAAMQKSIAIENRTCVKVPEPPQNLKIANALNPIFEYYKKSNQKNIHKGIISEKSITNAVKERNLSAKKD